MKKKFEMPAVRIDMFLGENVATTASGDNAVNMAAEMKESGYTVTTKSLTSFVW